MKRDTAREIAIQLIFSDRFNDIDIDNFLSADNLSFMAEDCDLYEESLDSKSSEYIRTIIGKYRENSERINELISQNSNGWSIKRISGTALAVLKCAVTEILYMEDIPIAASINSAVEIDKKYDEPDVVSFVNGVLGSIVKNTVSE